MVESNRNTKGSADFCCQQGLVLVFDQEGFGSGKELFLNQAKKLFEFTSLAGSRRGNRENESTEQAEGWLPKHLLPLNERRSDRLTIITPCLPQKEACFRVLDNKLSIIMDLLFILGKKTLRGSKFASS